MVFGSVIRYSADRVFLVASRDSKKESIRPCIKLHKSFTNPKRRYASVEYTPFRLPALFRGEFRGNDDSMSISSGYRRAQ